MRSKPTLRMFRKRLGGNQCVYCGDFTPYTDHFPPDTFGWRGWLIPACRECNTLAYTDFANSFFKRADLVKERLRRKYKTILRTPDWTVEELQEVEPDMARAILSILSLRDSIQRRLEWRVRPYVVSLLARRGRDD
jgi:hypothetical protein